MYPHVLTVTALNEAARALIEQGIGRVQVEGEISNLSRPGSGHLYFSLKDGGAAVACTLFKGAQMRLKMPVRDLRDGMAVLVTARAGMYVARGSYQLNIEQIEPAGIGRLEAEYQARLAKLTAEGLFDQARKRPIPPRPVRIGIITSPGAAALQDVLATLRRRNPALEITLYPAPVQGADAPPALIKALAKANAHGTADVLLIVRGGGSIEDLWAFNDEALARTVAASAIPIISGVGHETDTTLCDFAADLRAPTPTAAAENVSYPLAELLSRLAGAQQQLTRALSLYQRRHSDRLQQLEYRLERQNPRRALEQKMQRLDELHSRLKAAMARAQTQQREKIIVLNSRLNLQNPARRLQERKAVLANAQARLSRATAGRLQSEQARASQTAARFTAAISQNHAARRHAFLALTQRLELLSPLQVLSRGYAVAQDETGRVISRPQDTQAGELIQLRVTGGRIDCTVTATQADQPQSIV